MPTIIPERTIDSLFAFESLAALPLAEIYSPANNARRGTPDHTITVPAGAFVFELKTLSIKSQQNPDWYINIPKPQLAAYATHAPKTIYVLPAEPINTSAPWIRKCSRDPIHNCQCAACYVGSTDHPPLAERRWLGNHPSWKARTPEVRMQPWFSHWAWCISASKLEKLVNNSSLSSIKNLTHSWQISAKDSFLESLPGTDRLCHVLDTLASGPTSWGPLPGPSPSPEFSRESYISGHENSPEEEFVDSPRLNVSSLRWDEESTISQEESSRLTLVIP